MKSISLELTLLDPAGKAISVTFMGDESQVEFLTDLVENAQEYTEWIKAEKMGATANGWVN